MDRDPGHWEAPLMNLEQELFEAILENPDDIAARLVYADWCDDRGDPRGEFIRIQCELATYVGPPIKVRYLKRREAELWEQNRRAWNGEIHRRLARTPLRNRVDSRRGWIRSWEYHRGFVEFAVVEARAFLEYPEALFQMGPLKRVRLLHADTWLDDLLQSPYIKRLQNVELNLPNRPTENAKRLIASHARSLRRSVHIEPTHFRPASTRLHQTNPFVVSSNRLVDTFLMGCVGLAVLLASILLSTIVSTGLGRLLEIVVIKFNLGELFY